MKGWHEYKWRWFNWYGRTFTYRHRDVFYDVNLIGENDEAKIKKVWVDVGKLD